MANSRKVQIVGFDRHKGVDKNSVPYEFIIMHCLDESEAIERGVATITYRLTPEQANGLKVDDHVVIVSHWYKNKADKWSTWIDDILVIG